MADPAANRHIVKDISYAIEGDSWRWTYQRPELRFFLPAIDHLDFTMDFSLPEQLLRDTGPVTLSFFVNGRLLDRVRYDTGGPQNYRKAVPPHMLRARGENLVAIEPDKVWTDKTDGATLGFIVVRAGFQD